MTFKKLCEDIAKIEGKKQELSIAQIREVVSILCKIIILEPYYIAVLVQNGAKQWTKQLGRKK